MVECGSLRRQNVVHAVAAGTVGDRVGTHLSRHAVIAGQIGITRPPGTPNSFESLTLSWQAAQVFFTLAAATDELGSLGALMV